MLPRIEETTDWICNTRCDPKGPTLCRYSEFCTVPGTTVTLHIQGTGHFIRPDDMRVLLDKAQDEIETKFFEKERQDRMLLPDEVPWTIQHEGLTLRAQRDGWSWKLLNATIIGVRQCAFYHGKFQEIYIDSIQDPRALRPNGARFLNIVQRERPSPPPANTIDAPRPLPPGLKRCEDDSTQTRLLYELADPITGSVMQEMYDQAQKHVLTILKTQGDRMLVEEDLPWTYRSNGLILKADFEGWSFGFLNRTIGAMKTCTFERRAYREVIVYDVEGQNMPPGQRYIDLRRSNTFS